MCKVHSYRRKNETSYPIENFRIANNFTIIHFQKEVFDWPKYPNFRKEKEKVERKSENLDQKRNEVRFSKCNRVLNGKNPIINLLCIDF